MSNWKAYLKDVISPSDNTSSRKFITLLISGIFLLAQMLIVGFCFFLILYKTKGQVDKDLLDTLKDILRYDFYIILSGLGFVTSSDLVRIIISKGFNSNIKSFDDGDDDIEIDEDSITDELEEKEEKDLKKSKLKRKKKSTQAKISYD